MLIFLFLMNWFFALIFIFMNHPLSLGCILLFQTIILSLSLGFLYYNFFFSYILFLIMIGGMMIMFIYMTSIASNEKFSMPKNFMKIFSILFTFSFSSFLYIDHFLSNLLSLNFNQFNQSFILNNFTLNKFFCYPNMNIMITIMIYLFITLIAIVKIVGKNYGTLRQK